MREQTAAPRVKSFTCPQCGGAIAVRAAGISVTAICSHCGTVVDVANDNLKIIAHSYAKKRIVNLPIGTRGVLQDTEWEVIGYQLRSTDSEVYSWSEYLLFNPYRGFRFLVENNGHWTLLEVLRRNVRGYGGLSDTLLYDGREYRKFQTGGAKVLYVLGEFYWRVKEGDRTMTADYICPPFLLSSDESNDEILWSHGEYLQEETIEAAFAESVNGSGNTFRLPRQTGIAPNQPPRYFGRRQGIATAAAAFVALLVCTHVIVSLLADNTEVYKAENQVNRSNVAQTIVSPVFALDDTMGNVRLTVAAAVTNNWLEADLSLVNEATGKSYDTVQSVEFYQGYDSDGAWSEGSRQASHLMSAVPGGDYRLVYSIDAGGISPQPGQLYPLVNAQPVNYVVTVRRNVPMHGNFWTALIAGLLFPIWALIRHHNFESRRWQDSDLAPAIYRIGEGEE